MGYGELAPSNIDILYVHLLSCKFCTNILCISIYLFNDHFNHSGPASIRQLFAISIIVYRQINIVPADNKIQITCPI